MEYAAGKFKTNTKVKKRTTIIRDDGLKYVLHDWYPPKAVAAYLKKERAERKAKGLPTTRRERLMAVEKKLGVRG